MLVRKFKVKRNAMSHFDINLNSETVGSIAFTQPETRLSGVRIAVGFRLHIPALVTFHSPSVSGSQLILENLRAVLSSSGDGTQVEIGTALCGTPLRTTVRDQPVTLSWDWPLSSLAVYERLRAGREPKFRVMVYGEIRYVLPGDPGREACSIATPFHQWGEIGYSKKAWTDMLRELNLRDAVLVEIPNPADPPNGWEAVWQALRDARDSFDTGGSTGWKNCVASVRHSLEGWQQIEKEDQGPGWQRPSTTDLQNRTKAQRIDNLRWHLIQCAHLAPHTKADDWTRDDAILALSTLCALLAARRP